MPSLPPALQSIDGEDYHPSDGWRPRPHHLTKAQLWERIRNEARMDAVGGCRMGAAQGSSAVETVCMHTLCPMLHATKRNGAFGAAGLAHSCTQGTLHEQQGTKPSDDQSHGLHCPCVLQAVEPSLATFLHSVVLSHSGMEAAMAFLLANKLADSAGLLGAVQVSLKGRAALPHEHLASWLHGWHVHAFWVCCRWARAGTMGC